MNVTPSSIPEVLRVVPRLFPDKRGFFMETFSAQRYAEAGIPGPFVQDNHSHSSRGVLRGLHYQLRRPQGKLIWVTHGAIFDVAVDIRAGSPTFGQWVGETLSAENHAQLYVPPGFAHGFCVLSAEVDVFYKCTDYYDPSDDRGVLWSDPGLGIAWPVNTPLVSDKDARYAGLDALPREQLPAYRDAPR